MKFIYYKRFLFMTLLIFSFSGPLTAEETSKVNSGTRMPPIPPKIITEMTPHDTDDPAIWIHPSDPGKSLILGTDKDRDGGLYVFDLEGHMVKEKVIRPLLRPNNVDVEYGLKLAGKSVDIAVVTERLTHKLRIFSLPDMKPLDNGGLPVFQGQTSDQERDLMGISLYRRPRDGAVFAIVGRKRGPSGSYLWQYHLHDDGSGLVNATLVRKFGKFSGVKEIEAIAVDDTLGYVYYSDEGVGVRKYYADPADGNEELALFATKGFKKDHEGISIYCETPETGYILVSDQGANRFHIFPRQGTPANPHEHPMLSVVNLMISDSDGSEVTATPLGTNFPKGLFVAMSNDKTFQYYSWEDIAGRINLSENK